MVAQVDQRAPVVRAIDADAKLFGIAAFPLAFQEFQAPVFLAGQDVSEPESRERFHCGGMLFLRVSGPNVRQLTEDEERC